MKALFILLLFITNGLFAQENPWENKSEENPWKNTPKNNGSTISDSIANQIYLSNQELLDEAKQNAKNDYNSKRAFGFGFTSGLILNVYGVFPDFIYAVVDTKEERKVLEQIENDPTYDSLQEEDLKSTTENGIKSKKLFSSLKGTLLGSVTQLGIIIVLIFTF